MGGRGSFASGKHVPYKWETVSKIGDAKILVSKQGSTRKLPEESHSPNSKYVFYDEKTGNFKMLRVYNENRLPELEIAFGPHLGKEALHWHWLRGDVANRGGQQGVDWDWLHPGDPLYEQYKSVIERNYRHASK